MKEKIHLVFYKISKHDNFKFQVNADVSKVFYHLYLKTKRNFLAIEKLLSDSETNNSFVEAFPLLRIIVENYLHMCFLAENEPLKVKSAYESLSKYEAARTASKLSNITGMHETEQEFIDSTEMEYKMPAEYKVLADIRSLASQTNNLTLYRKYYSVLSSYVHFNPSTYFNYGNEMEDGFKFNAKVIDEEGSNQFNELYMRIVVMFLAKVTKYLEIPIPSTLEELCKDILSKES